MLQEVSAYLACYSFEGHYYKNNGKHQLGGEKEVNRSFGDDKPELHRKWDKKYCKDQKFINRKYCKQYQYQCRWDQPQNSHPFPSRATIS